MSTMKVEELERFAYITRHPRHPLLAMLVDEEWDCREGLEYEIRGLKEELEQLKECRDNLRTELDNEKEKREVLKGEILRVVKEDGQ